MLYLVEHFFSFQGEGLYSGRASIFLRFGGCNLKCSGFGVQSISTKDSSVLIGCDSQKAVNKSHFGDNWTLVNSDKLIKIIETYESSLNYTPDIVITGGEPLLNIEDINFIELIEYIKSKSSRVTIESNTTIKIDFNKYPIYKYPIYSMAIKLSNSNEKYEHRVNPDAIEAIILNTKNSYFKFALDSDYICKYGANEIKSITMKYFQTSIYCMPIGESIEALSQNDKSVIEFCKKYGYIYTDRTHIRVYNKRDGV